MSMTSSSHVGKQADRMLQKIRTPQACENCRRRKTKCDGGRPSCRACLKCKRSCLWPKTLAPGNYCFIDSTSPADNQIRPQSVGAVDSDNDGPLPKSTVLQQMFGIFFTHHHDVELCSFFHKPSLDIAVLCDRSPFLVNAIVSLSALYLSEDETRKDFGFGSASEVSEHYASAARLYARNLSDEPSVYSIQAYLVLALRELLTWTSFKAWMYTGIAIRMAQALRLGSEFNQRYSPRQKETRRRTYWACFIMDRLISYCCGRPVMIDMISVRIRLPCPENVFVFEAPYSAPCFDTIISCLPQSLQLGILPFYANMVHLWSDMAMLHIYGGRRRSKHVPTDPTGEFHRFEKAIEELETNLPPNMLWSAHNYKLYGLTGQAQIFVNFHFLLKHAKCVMHQEYLPQLDTQFGITDGTIPATIYDSAGLSLDYQDERLMTTCMRSARDITEIATLLHRGSDEDRRILRSTFAANALMTATGVFLWAQYTQFCDKCPREESKASADMLLRIIKSWQPQWHVAVAWAETLEMLSQLYEFSYGDAETLDAGLYELGTDDLGIGIADAALSEEAAKENGAHPGCKEGDGMPDPASIYQRLWDKVRSVMLTPLEATEVKKRILRHCLGTLCQHMWGFRALQGMGDTLGSVDGFEGWDLVMAGSGDQGLDGEFFEFSNSQ